MRVLVAEDDASIRTLVQAGVERLGHTVAAVADGAQAWQEYQRHGADVVVSDWLMPEMEGPELCRHIRAQARAPYTYFIMLTALDGPQHALTAMQAGADDFLNKPFNLHQLRRRLIAAERVTGLYRRLERDLARREALLRSARRFAAEGSPDEILDDLLRQATAITGADDASLVRRIDDQQVEVARGAAPRRRERIALADDALSWALAFGRAVIAEPESGVAIPRWAANEGARSFLAVPLANDGQVVGALTVTSRSGEHLFTADDAEVLELLGSTATATVIGLERAWANGVLAAARAAEQEMNDQVALAQRDLEALTRDPELPERLRASAALAVQRADALADILNQLRGLIRSSGDWPFGEEPDPDLGAPVQLPAALVAAVSRIGILPPPGEPDSAELRQARPAPAQPAETEPDEPLPSAALMAEAPPFADSQLGTARIDLVMRPIQRFTQLGVITRALRGLPGVEDVVTRQFHKNTVVLRVRYDDPVPLLERLRGLSDFRCQLVAEQANRVELEVSFSPGSPARSASPGEPD